MSNNIKYLTAFKLYLQLLTGLWLGYNGLRNGPDQVITKSPGKPWKMAGLEIDMEIWRFVH